MAVEIHVLSNTRAKVEGDFDTDALDEELRFHPDGYQFSPSYRRHVWDGWVHIFSTKSCTFPLGLLGQVKRHFKKTKAKFTVIDTRRPPLKVAPIPEVLGGLTLRPYQKKMVRLALAAQRGVVKCATGGGKTLMQAAIMKSFWGDLGPPRTLVLVPNRALLRQTVAEFENFLDTEIGTIGYGKWNENWITVAIPDTLGNRKFDAEFKQLMKHCELLLVDECHHSPSSKWYNLLTRCQAFYRYGFSGTPLDRHDGASLRLIGLTGDLVGDIRSETLVEQGTLARPSVEFIEVDKPELPDRLDYENVYSLGVVRNLNFHKLVAQRIEKAFSEGKSVLALVTRIEHGESLDRALWTYAKFVPHEFVHYKSGDDVIEDAKTRFKAGDLKVLISSPIFGEGVDLPSMDVLVVCDGGKSVIKVVQKAGRAMRPKVGKPNVCRIVDFAHYTHHYLLEHSFARFKVYEREGFAIEDTP